MRLQMIPTPHIAASFNLPGIMPTDRARAEDIVAVRRQVQVTERNDLRALSVDFWRLKDAKLEEVMWDDLSNDFRTHLQKSRPSFDQAIALPKKHEMAMRNNDVFQIIFLSEVICVIYDTDFTAYYPESASSHHRLRAIAEAENVYNNQLAVFKISTSGEPE